MEVYSKDIIFEIVELIQIIQWKHAVRMFILMYNIT